MSTGRWFTSADRIGVGTTLIVVGVGLAAQGWPFVPSMFIGFGVGTLIAGQWGVVREARTPGGESR